jgi:hypothetical protein
MGHAALEGEQFQTASRTEGTNQAAWQEVTLPTFDSYNQTNAF